MQVDVGKLDELVAQKWLRREEHSYLPLSIYNYTEHCQFEKHWTPETLMCRGLIVSNSGTIVARPFPKFFNYGEQMPASGAKLVEATEKMDGSLGILYRYERHWGVATRGSFRSDQAKWATQYLSVNGFEVDDVPHQWTYLFEIIYPENRIVVDYADWSGLVFLAQVNNETGEEKGRTARTRIAIKHGWMQPHVYQMTDTADYLAAAKDLSANKEGWVLKYSDGARFKIKGEAYKVAHRLMTGISFSRVLEAVSNGTLDGWLEGVPDEFLVTIHQYRDEINARVSEVTGRVQARFDEAPKGNRKQFALWTVANCPDLRAYMFELWDGREDITPMIYKQIARDHSVAVTQ